MNVMAKGGGKSWDELYEKAEAVQLDVARVLEECLPPDTILRIRTPTGDVLDGGLEAPTENVIEVRAALLPVHWWGVNLSC
jgi:hypothetical protein